MNMRFRVLGPLEIHGDGPIPITAPRQQVILSLLLLDANKVVPLEKIINAMWDDGPPATARAQVQTSISALRRSLQGGGLGERIRMQGLGYAIELAPGELDLHVFGELVAAGRSALTQGLLEQARTAFRTALDLWRGAPLSGVDSAVVQATLIQTIERRIEVLEACLDVELELGHHHQIVAELKALTAEYPLREHLAGQLMTALYRSGRQAEALGAYRTLRKAFVDELGLEPSAPLRRLEHDILNGYADLDHTPAWPGTRASQTGAQNGYPLAGSLTSAEPATPALAAVAGSETRRTPDEPAGAGSAAPRPAGEPARVRTAPVPAASGVVTADMMAAGVGALLVAAPSSTATSVAGPAAGMPVPRMLPAQTPDFTGRAALLQQLCERLGAESGDGRQVAVVTGRGGVGKSTMAIAAAHRLARAFPDGQLYARLAAGAPAVLECFLRALGFAGSSIPDDFDERVALYRNAISGRRILVVIEDAADETQTRPLLPGTPTCRLILTSRERLVALPGAHVVELDVLDTRGGVELITALLGRERVSASPSDAIELTEVCGGLPLALRIAANRLIARPHWTIADLTARLQDEAHLLDELTHQGLGVREVLDATYDGLKPAAKRLLGRLGVLASEDFGAWVAGPLLDLQTGEAADVLETLVDARLVDVFGGVGTAARYRLHRLVGAYSREQLSSEEPAGEALAAWHRVLGAWLFLVDETNRRRRNPEYAGPPGDAVRWKVPGADRLLADPMAWYGRERMALLATMMHAAHSETAEACWNLAVAAASLADAHGNHADWRQSQEAALLAAARAQDQRGEAALLLSLGTLDLRQHRFDEAAIRFELALGVFDHLGDVQWRAQALRATTLLHRARSSARLR